MSAVTMLGKWYASAIMTRLTCSSSTGEHTARSVRTLPGRAMSYSQEPQCSPCSLSDECALVLHVAAAHESNVQQQHRSANFTARSTLPLLHVIILLARATVQPSSPSDSDECAQVLHVAATHESNVQHQHRSAHGMARSTLPDHAIVFRVLAGVSLWLLLPL